MVFKRRLRAQHGYYTAADVTTDEGGIGGRRGSDRPFPSVIATDVNYMEFQHRSAAAGGLAGAHVVPGARWRDERGWAFDGKGLDLLSRGHPCPQLCKVPGLEGQAVIEHARESVRSVEAMTVSTRAEAHKGGDDGFGLLWLLFAIEPFWQ